MPPKKLYVLSGTHLTPFVPGRQEVRHTTSFQEFAMLAHRVREWKKKNVKDITIKEYEHVGDWLPDDPRFREGKINDEL